MFDFCITWINAYNLFFSASTCFIRLRVIAMSSENFLIDLLDRINDYVRYNTPDLESRIILERFLAVVALAFIQLLLVRYDH